MSQGKIYTEECRDADNPSYMSSCLILLLAYILLTLGITSETWYSLNIDVDNCAQCGPFVVAIGETFERATVVNFTVEEYVRMYFGIWNVTVCTTERVCVNMTLSDADKQFGSLEIFSPAIGKICFIVVRLCMQANKSAFMLLVLFSIALLNLLVM